MSPNSIDALLVGTLSNDPIRPLDPREAGRGRYTSRVNTDSRKMPSSSSGSLAASSSGACPDKGTGGEDNNSPTRVRYVLAIWGSSSLPGKLPERLGPTTRPPTPPIRGVTDAPDDTLSEDSRLRGGRCAESVDNPLCSRTRERRGTSGEDATAARARKEGGESASKRDCGVDDALSSQASGGPAREAC